VVLALIATFGPTAARAALPGGRLVLGGVVSAAVGLGIVLVIHYATQSHGAEETLATSRNFYVVLRVNHIAESDDNGPKRDLVHGQTQHGFQFLDADKRRWPTSYYGESSGIGLAIRHHPRRRATDPDARTLRIGVVGLGCGTLAAYGEAGDTIRFYEINPEVIRISDEYFTYRRDSAATIDIVLGDARINLERELAAGDTRRFDVLAIDAFSSDSIPMHLLTKECVELYRQLLKPDGLLCIHISNNFLDLSGVVYGIATAVGWQCVFVESAADASLGTDVATWAIVTANEEFLKTHAVRKSITPWNPKEHSPQVWTDDYGSLWHVLRP
jgi:hypothetical protein